MNKEDVTVLTLISYINLVFDIPYAPEQPVY